jgi:hypothetical protein
LKERRFEFRIRNSSSFLPTREAGGARIRSAQIRDGLRSLHFETPVILSATDFQSITDDGCASTLFALLHQRSACFVRSPAACAGNKQLPARLVD